MRALTACGLVGFAAAMACSGPPMPAATDTATATAEAAAPAPPPARVTKLREDALASARVWMPPPVRIAQANLRDNPPGAGRFAPDADVDCRFTLEQAGGTTPKFYCEMAGGEALKIKYGSGNAELPAEVAATRLLSALGFGADRMYVVRRVRCAGCPSYPFHALRCMQQVGMQAACFPGGIDYERVVDFDSAVIERRLEGRKIEATPGLGWAWYELDKIDPARGGSPLAEVDALRLMAVFLAHWDNKAENQRLLCLADGPDGTCTRSLAIMQDVGATFGPTKLDLHNWRNTRIWTDGATCAVSMKNLPFNGATFPDRKISEEGRTLLLGWLEQLSDRQLRDLFEGSGVTSLDQLSAEARNADAWVAAFKDKVQQIRQAGPCGEAISLSE